MDGYIEVFVSSGDLKSFLKGDPVSAELLEPLDPLRCKLLVSIESIVKIQDDRESSIRYLKIKRKQSK